MLKEFVFRFLERNPLLFVILVLILLFFFSLLLIFVYLIKALPAYINILYLILKWNQGPTRFRFSWYGVEIQPHGEPLPPAPLDQLLTQDPMGASGSSDEASQIVSSPSPLEHLVPWIPEHFSFSFTNPSFFMLLTRSYFFFLLLGKREEEENRLHVFMLTEERIQYTSDFFLRKCSKYLRNLGPHDLVAQARSRRGQSTTRSSLSLEPNPQHWLMAPP